MCQNLVLESLTGEMFGLSDLSNTSCTRLEIHFSALLSLWFVLGLCRCSIYLEACSSRGRIALSLLTCLHQGKQKCRHRLLMPIGRDFQYCSVAIAIAFTACAYLNVQFPCSCNINCLEIICSHSPFCRLTAVCCSFWDYRLLTSMIQWESHSLIAQFNPCKKRLSGLSPRLRTRTLQIWRCWHKCSHRKSLCPPSLAVPVPTECKGPGLASAKLSVEV